MAKMKENTRITTYNKLVRLGKGTEKEIQKLQIEDLKDVTDDEDVKNIILLREHIKNRRILDYFDCVEKTGKGENKNEE